MTTPASNADLNRLIAEAAGSLCTCEGCGMTANTVKGIHLAGRKAICRVLDDLVAILFPGCHGSDPVPPAHVRTFIEERLQESAEALREQIERAFRYQCQFDKCKDCGDCVRQAEQAVRALIVALPDVKCTLQQDVTAAYEGDPAARSSMEVVMSYPGIYAITVHRLAHSLYQQEVPIIPRVMSEHAHTRTGIDIHPGAQIGPGFFIDHGTGVVIGETCTIGRRVKLYPGVTLGALSFAKDAQGRLVKGTKRHPDVEDGVVIYAGATILGGDTRIGHDSVIGANVWLIHSVPPFSKVYNQEAQPYIRPAASVPWSPVI